MEQRTRTTEGKKASSSQSHTLPHESGSSERFITCLVTPKITFSLPNQGWSHAEDISQADLRKAFLTRFPIECDIERIVFTPVLNRQPTDVPGVPSRVVFKIGARSSAGSDSLVDDESVLLAIFQTLDKAYATRHQAQLMSAKREMLSSCMSFELMADEIRRAQEGAALELSRVKEQASTSQKRLFILELEKDQLKRLSTSSDVQNEALRHRVDALSAENHALRSQLGSMSERLDALTNLVVSGSTAETARAADGAQSEPEQSARLAPANQLTIGVQTSGPSIDKYLSSMAAWLRQGSDILEMTTNEQPEPVAVPAAAVSALADAASGPSISGVRAASKGTAPAGDSQREKGKSAKR